MKPFVNFASHPFRNRRLFWLLVSAIVAGATLIGLNILEAKARLDNQIAALEPVVSKLEKDAKTGTPIDFSGSSLSIAQNQALLAAQDLINRKGFSWSQLLNDLEQHIPLAVRVTRISVDKVSGQQKANAGGRTVSLSFDAVGKSSSAMTQMLDELNRSAKFSANPKSVKSVEGTEEVEFQLDVEYRPSRLAGNNSNTQIASGEVRK